MRIAARTRIVQVRVGKAWNTLRAVWRWRWKDEMSFFKELLHFSSEVLRVLALLGTVLSIWMKVWAAFQRQRR